MTKSIFSESFTIADVKFTRCERPANPIGVRQLRTITLPEGFGRASYDLFRDGNKAYARLYSFDFGDVAWYTLSDAEKI